MYKIMCLINIPTIFDIYGVSSVIAVHNFGNASEIPDFETRLKWRQRKFM